VTRLIGLLTIACAAILAGAARPASVAVGQSDVLRLKTAEIVPVAPQVTKPGGKSLVLVSPEHDPVVAPLPVGPNRPVVAPSPPSNVQSASPASARGPNDPIAILTNTKITVPKGEEKQGSGWETSEGSKGNVVFMSGNWFGAYSKDAGATFSYVSPYSTFPSSGGQAFCCDSVVQYVPSIDRFVWVLQYSMDSANENFYRVAVASPDQVVASAGTKWTFWDLKSKAFHQDGHWFDYDDLSFGSHYLYLSFNVPDTHRGIVARLSLGDLEQGTTLHGRYFVGSYGVHPAENVGKRAYFAAQLNTSRLRFFIWHELSTFVAAKDILISSFDDSNYSTTDPDGFDWLSPDGKISSRIMGGLRVGGQVWFAWSAGRNKQFPQPYIDIVKIDRRHLSLAGESQIWNPSYAFAYPSLQITASGDVGLVFEWGGGQAYSNVGVGFLTGTQDLISATGGAGHVGGHYITARPYYPAATCLSAAGWQQTGKTKHPHWILFSRRGTKCSA
jgi:hypothetical protein